MKFFTYFFAHNPQKYMTFNFSKEILFLIFSMEKYGSPFIGTYVPNRIEYEITVDLLHETIFARPNI
jgi:hypothetical protein